MNTLDRKRGEEAQVRKIWFDDCPEEAALDSKNAVERKRDEPAQVRKIWFYDCPEEAALASKNAVGKRGGPLR